MQTDCRDMAKVHGGEIVQHLNEPFSPGLLNAYDLAIDSGTLEHCFNVRQLVAHHRRCADGRRHRAPWESHGHDQSRFPQFSPQFHSEAHSANGFKILGMFDVEETPGQLRIERADSIACFQLPSPANRPIRVIARKEGEVETSRPMHSKHQVNPGPIRPAGHG